MTFTFVSRGRRGTILHPRSFCVAGVALMVLGGALGPGLGGRDTAAFCVAGVALGDRLSRGRRGTNSHLPSFCVAGVALMAGWRPWARFRRAWRRGIQRGRHSTWWHALSFRVAGVALMVLGGALGPGLGGRDAAAFCVAGVALGDIHFHFAWQAWHKLTSTVVLRGRRGTYGTGWRPWARFAARYFFALASSSGLWP